MCPYARFQSAMFDKDTLIIGYDTKRGEPRGKHKTGTGWEGRGHCIDCTACVQVCPMGIDIRDGLQMECIACGLCIDACDGIMDRIGLPKGLIRYDTTHHMQAEVKGGKEKFHLLRPRTIYYTAVISIVGIMMICALIFRAPLELHVLHDRTPLFVQLSDGQIRNGYTLKILNKTHVPRTLGLTVEGIENAQIEVKAAGETEDNLLKVRPDSIASYHVLVSSKMEPAESKDIVFTLSDTENNTISTTSTSVFITRRER